MKAKQEKGALTKARILVDCPLGNVNDVVEVDAETAKQFAASIDVNSDAVAYAESLKGK